ncbi:hypothetical protein P7L78_20250 [Tistrella bauzanensis]|uniref:Uncharacterized protein n=1 Tax=Tistrella arctica TaxID=3133430 RepID=A0ABU9YPD6_9PROT
MTSAADPVINRFIDSIRDDHLAVARLTRASGLAELDAIVAQLATERGLSADLPALTRALAYKRARNRR